MNTTETPDSRRTSASDNSPRSAQGAPSQPTGHSLQANERRDMLVRGVREVLSFDEHNVRLVTTAGILNLEGRELRIHTLNTKDGIVTVTGILDGVLYENDAADAPTAAPASGKRRFGRLR